MSIKKANYANFLLHFCISEKNAVNLQPNKHFGIQIVSYER